MGQGHRTTRQELPVTPPQLSPAIAELDWRWGRPEFAASFLTARHSESSGPSDGVPGQSEGKGLGAQATQSQEDLGRGAEDMGL